MQGLLSMTRWHDHRELPLELLEPVVTVPWQLGPHADATLGDLLDRIAKLDADPCGEVAEFLRFLDHKGNLPLTIYLSRRTRTAAMKLAASRSSQPEIIELMRFLDAPVIEVLLLHRVPLDEIDLALGERCTSDDWPVMAAGLWAEVRKLLKPDKRGVSIVGKCFGITAPEPTTLAALGTEIGLSSERIRQLRDRVLPPTPIRTPGYQLKTYPEPLFPWSNRRSSKPREREGWRFLPGAVRAVRSLRQSEIPLTLTEWHSRLPEPLRRHPASELRAVPLLKKWLGGYSVFTIRKLGVEWFHTSAATLERVADELPRIARVMRAMARRLVLPPELGLTDPWQRQIAEQFLATGAEGWHRAREGWWIQLENDRWQPGRIVAQLLGAVGPTSLGQIQRGLERVKVGASRREQESLIIPPPRILREILRNDGYSIDRYDVVELGNRDPEPLSESQRILLETFRNEGPLISRTTATDRLREQQMTMAAATVLLETSPLIRQVDRRLYMLNGVEFDSDEISLLERRLAEQAKARLLGSSATFDRSVVAIRYRVTQRGRPWRYPIGEYEPSKGNWTFDAGNYLAKIQVRDGWIHGLRRLESRAWKAGVREMEVHFIEPSRTVTLLIVDRFGRRIVWSKALTVHA